MATTAHIVSASKNWLTKIVATAPSKVLRLLKAPSPTSEKYQHLRSALQTNLSLTAEETDQILQRLPFELSISAHVDEHRWSHLTSALQKADVSYQTDPASLSWPACPRHWRLAQSELCPKCGGRNCAVCRHLSPHGLCPHCQQQQSFWRKFKLLRIGLLLAALFAVWYFTQQKQAQIHTWTKPLQVGIVPIAATDDHGIQTYIESLQAGDFAPVDAFFVRTGHSFGIDRETYFQFVLGDSVETLPPTPPQQADILGAMAYSLQLRFWAWRIAADTFLPKVDIRLFLVLHRVEDGATLEHSVGFQEGHLGVVHAFADPNFTAQNHVVMAHELLHTLGATDKYDQRAQPIFPDGYADPTREPLLPQELAEIMAGAVPVTSTESKLADSLLHCIVGEKTAQEIGWLQK